MQDQTTRRNFLKHSTLAGLGIVAEPLSFLRLGIKVAEEPRRKLKKGQRLVSILQTTDVHCQLHAHDELFWENSRAVFRKAGGYAHIATYFAIARKQNPDTFIVDTGDIFQGSQLSVETTGQAMQPILNKIGYDLYIPGNWEVVYNKENMLNLMGGLEAPTICSNMYHDLGDGKKGDLLFPPYYTWRVAGIKIGFLSYTDPLVPVRQSPEYSKEILYTHPGENLQRYIQVLRHEEKCDFVILLSHLGLSQQIALGDSPVCKGVDYIFGGDTHERVRKPIVCKYSKVVEPGAFGSFVGRLELVVENGKVVDDHYALDEISPVKYEADSAIMSVIRGNEQPYRHDITQIIGYSTIPLYRYFVVENPIDTLIIDALMWKIKPDIVLSNGFRFCPPNTTRDKTGNIPITQGYVYDMLPVDSVIRTGEVTGAQLKAWVEKELNNVFAKNAVERLGGWLVKFKGMVVEFNVFRAPGQRVQKITINDSPVDPLKLYMVSACEREGDPDNMLCRMPDVKGTMNTPFTLHEVVKDYLSVHSPVTPKPEGNAIILDAPSTMLTQVFGVHYQFI